MFKLKKSNNNKERLDFITNYNHSQGLLIVEDNEYIYALEKGEELKTDKPIEKPIKKPRKKKVKE